MSFFSRLWPGGIRFIWSSLKEFIVSHYSYDHGEEFGVAFSLKTRFYKSAYTY